MFCTRCKHGAKQLRIFKDKPSMEAAARNLEMILRPIVEPTGLDTRDEHLATPPPPPPRRPPLPRDPSPPGTHRCHWNDYCQQGAGGRRWQHTIQELVDEVLAPAIVGRRALLAHPAATEPCPHAPGEPITLFIGPEGGFIDHEVERLRGIGFEPVALGERILRVEPVIPLLVGRLFG